MKSAYWNKLFFDLIPKEEKDDFSMNTWNKFFDEIGHMRNTSSHTCANFKNKKTFNSIKIQRGNKKIEVSKFVFHLEKVFNFNFKIKKFLKNRIK